MKEKQFGAINPKGPVFRHRVVGYMSNAGSVANGKYLWVDRAYHPLRIHVDIRLPLRLRRFDVACACVQSDDRNKFTDPTVLDSVGVEIDIQMEGCVYAVGLEIAFECARRKGKEGGVQGGVYEREKLGGKEEL